jgi:hypothetical protein
MLHAERPYDWNYRIINHLDYRLDYSYYNGRYFCYFGPVPAVMVMLPFLLITGHDMPTRLVCLFFMLWVVLALWWLWREIVRRFLPGIPAWFYLGGLITLMLGTNLYYLAQGVAFYDIASLSGLALVTTGLALALRARRQTKGRVAWLVQIGAAASAMALAVGCRPNLVLVSALLPVALWGSWRLANNRRLWQLIPVVAAPYLVVAACLMYYNHVRFGSVLEFGASYQLTVANISLYTTKSLHGMIATIAGGVWTNFFPNISNNSVFPYLGVTAAKDLPGLHGYLYHEIAVAIGFVPIVWCLLALPCIRKRSSLAKARPLLWTMVLVGIALLVASVVSGGVHGRYQLDFLWLLVLPGVVLLGQLTKQPLPNSLRHLPAMAICLVTCLVMISSSLSGQWSKLQSSNPDIYYQLGNLLQFW